MRLTPFSFLCLAILVACGGEADPANKPSTELPGEEPGEEPGEGPSLDERKAEVCQTWSDARERQVQVAWSGSASSCDPGGAPGVREAAVELTNAYRFLAGLDPVAEDVALNGQAQHCALAMHANRTLNHQPPEDWLCLSPEARTAAANSNLAMADAWRAVDQYMADFGEHNAATLGHRRWLLSPALQEVGIGSTDSFSCMWVIHSMADGEKDFVAWPPPGPVPLEVVRGVNPFYGSLDDLGWSIQSNGIDLRGGTIRVTEDGVERSGATSELLPNYGSRHALKFIPEGWETQPGKIYAVSVEGVGAEIEYEFELVDCAEGA